VELPPLLTGIVLAGGKSRRFGTDKADALLGDRTLLEHVVAVLEDVADSIVIVGRTARPPSRRPVACVGADRRRTPRRAGV